MARIISVALHQSQKTYDLGDITRTASKIAKGNDSFHRKWFADKLVAKYIFADNPTKIMAHQVNKALETLGDERRVKV
jgi:hypothetical protein